MGYRKVIYILPIFTDLHVIALRGEIDDAVSRFERSLQVFGYKYTFVDVSTYGRTPKDVSFSDKLHAIRRITNSLDSEFVLILDSHMSLLLNRPADLIYQAHRTGADFFFVELDANSGKRLPSGDEIFSGMLARTKNLNKLIETLPDEPSDSQTDKFIGALNNELVQVIS